MIQKIFFNPILLLAPLLIVACDNSLKEDKRNDEEKIIESIIKSKKLTYTKSEGVYMLQFSPPLATRLAMATRFPSGIRATPSSRPYWFLTPILNRKLLWPNSIPIPVVLNC
jgi:hypothetical protein